MLTAHTTWAMSATTSALDVVPFGRRDGGRLEPVGSAGRDPLLVEGFAGRAVGEALQHGGAAAGRVEEVLADLEVVRDEVELGGAELGEVHLVGPGDAHRAPVDLDFQRVLVVPGHHRRL